jgi:uncharacterized heparinase superfamily protein
VSSATRLKLLWHTARHLKPSQVVGRLRLRTQAAVRRLAPHAAQQRYQRIANRAGLQTPRATWRPSPSPVAARDLSVAEDWARAECHAGQAVSGRFTFLNETVDLGRPVAWHAPQQSQLWRYQLHYGSHLIDLVATRADGWTDVESLMSEWTLACRLGEVRDPWHPFVVSERLVNWLLAIQCGAPSIEAVSPRVWQSLAVQTVFVDRNLETDVGGNHLLKNLKAMSIASCVWRGPVADDWRARYVAAFDRELANQLLADGAHYERSPMYHMLVLADAVEVVLALRLANWEVPESLIASIQAMIEYLPQVLHPDGEIALFNDSVLGETPQPECLCAAARLALGETPAGRLTARHALLAAALREPLRVRPGTSARSATEDSGIVRIPAIDGRGVLIMDVGRACPDALPAHAHADFFSYELSLDGRRLVVDAGVGEYAEGPWREYYRSTRAHNTVSVDGLDQIECWGSFRVARRADVLDRAAIHGPLLTGIRARHNGYARLPDPVGAARAIVCLDDRAWLVIDELEGAGIHSWESCLHASPDADVSMAGSDRAVLTRGGQILAVAWFGVDEACTVRGQPSPRQGWHAPAFGRHLPVWTLVLRGRGAVPARFGYLLAPLVDAADAAIARSARGIHIRLGTAEYDVEGTGAGLSARRRVA